MCTKRVSRSSSSARSNKTSNPSLPWLCATSFYRAMLQEGRSPADALRQAQLGQWHSRRWHAPFYWAAFVLQGEPR